MSDRDGFVNRRRHPQGRREADALREDRIAEQRSYIDWLRHTTVRALVAWAVVSTVACGALVWALARAVNQSNETAHQLGRAGLALSRANSAIRQAHEDDRAIRAQAVGLCRAIADNRSYVDEAHHAIRAVFLAEGAFQLRTGEHLARGISRGVREAGQIQQRLGRTTIGGANAILTARPPNCERLATRPLHYRIPTPVPIGPRGR